MKYVLTKASDDNYMEIVDYGLEQINALAVRQEIIIRQNPWLNEYEIVSNYIAKPKSFCDELTQIPMEIMIYDDYIE